ncbi:MAG: four helix bundle protein [Pirellulales bacterium]|nr:four helix bundle protein [Pirellulales bacterium]
MRDEEPLRRAYDLAERTAAFGERVVRFARHVPRDDVTGPLIRQLVRSATSIGANYAEADEAGSPKEFCTELASAVAKREKRNIGCACSLPLRSENRTKHDCSGKKPMN